MYLYGTKNSIYGKGNNLNIKNFLKLNIKRLYWLIFSNGIDPVRYHVSDKLKLVYIENPKVACSSIKSRIYPEKANSKMAIHPFGDKQSELWLKNIPKGYTFFTVVRNPEERILSCFRDKIARNENSPFNFFLYKVIFFVFSGIKLRPGKMSLEEFVIGVSKVPDCFADRHIKSQYSLVKELTKNDIDCKVLKFENLNSSWNEMITTFDLLPLPVVNSTTKTNIPKTTPELKKLIQERYENDYKHFGYKQ